MLDKLGILICTKEAQVMTQSCLMHILSETVLCLRLAHAEVIATKTHLKHFLQETVHVYLPALFVVLRPKKWDFPISLVNLGTSR